MADVLNDKRVHPKLEIKLKELQKILSKNNIKIAFSAAYRSIDEQDRLYNQGRTTPGQVVTNARGSSYSSQHQWGIAADFYLDMDVDGDGKKSDDAFNNSTNLFIEVGNTALAMGLGWGGTWSKPDYPHIYLPYWGSTTKALKNAYGNPEQFQKTWNCYSDTDSYKEIDRKEDSNFVSFVKGVQRCIGAKVDGIVGAETLRKTVTVSSKQNVKHPVVRVLQTRFNELGFNCGTVDGIAGRKFDSAVRNYQKSIGFKNPDGIMDSGKRTWKSILRVKGSY